MDFTLINHIKPSISSPQGNMMTLGKIYIFDKKMEKYIL